MTSAVRKARQPLAHARAGAGGRVLGRAIRKISIVQAHQTVRGARPAGTREADGTVAVHRVSGLRRLPEII